MLCPSQQLPADSVSPCICTHACRSMQLGSQVAAVEGTTHLSYHKNRAHQKRSTLSRKPLWSVLQNHQSPKFGRCQKENNIFDLHRVATFCLNFFSLWGIFFWLQQKVKAEIAFSSTFDAVEVEVEVFNPIFRVLCLRLRRWGKTSFEVKALNGTWGLYYKKLNGRRGG